MSHRVTLIPGDGIGPELARAATRAVEATGVAVEWDLQTAGAACMEREGTRDRVPPERAAGAATTGRMVDAIVAALEPARV